MKVLIDINENDYKVLEDMKNCGLGYYHEAILNGKVIPDGATNGDIETTLFPNEYWQCTSDETGEQLITDGNNHFDLGWWNSSYEEKESR